MVTLNYFYNVFFLFSVATNFSMNQFTSDQHRNRFTHITTLEDIKPFLGHMIVYSKANTYPSWIAGEITNDPNLEVGYLYLWQESDEIHLKPVVIERPSIGWHLWLTTRRLAEEQYHIRLATADEIHRLWYLIQYKKIQLKYPTIDLDQQLIEKCLHAIKAQLVRTPRSLMDSCLNHFGKFRDCQPADIATIEKIGNGKVPTPLGIEVLKKLPLPIIKARLYQLIDIASKNDIDQSIKKTIVAECASPYIFRQLHVFFKYNHVSLEDKIAKLVDIKNNDRIEYLS